MKLKYFNTIFVFALIWRKICDLVSKIPYSFYIVDYKIMVHTLEIGLQPKFLKNNHTAPCIKIHNFFRPCLTYQQKSTNNTKNWQKSSIGSMKPILQKKLKKLSWIPTLKIIVIIGVDFTSIWPFAWQFFCSWFSSSFSSFTQGMKTNFDKAYKL